MSVTRVAPGVAMPVNYAKWDKIDDSDEDEASPSNLAASDMASAGATELPPGAARAFLDALCAAVFTSFSTEDGRNVCTAALRRALPGVASLDEELKQHVLGCHFFLPSCLPPCAAKAHPVSVRVANKVLSAPPAVAGGGGDANSCALLVR